MPVDPATLKVIHFPAPILRAKSRPVPAVTPEVRAVALRMIEMMREHDGIGLAANQVGLDWRLFVAHVPPTPGDPERSATSNPVTATVEAMVFINPVLSQPERDLEPLEEGCLSLPEISGEVRRPSAITVTALGLDGESFTMRAAGLLARCWQHEVDHLDGVLILDRMTQLSRMKNRTAIRDLEAAAERRVR
jgi:peptide deformylase